MIARNKKRGDKIISANNEPKISKPLLKKFLYITPPLHSKSSLSHITKIDNYFLIIFQIIPQTKVKIVIIVPRKIEENINVFA